MSSLAWSLNWAGFVVLIAMAAYVIQLESPPNAISTLINPLFHKHALTLEQQVKNLPAEYRKGCPSTPFTSVKLVSRSPEIILIEGFLSAAEAAFLMQVAYLPCLFS